MFSPRLIRKLAAASTVLGLLFTQFAVAAYACPMVSAVLESESASSDCCDHDMPQPGLCHAHCDEGGKTVADHSTASAVFMPAYVVQMAEPASSITATMHFNRASANANAPPLALRPSCLRI